MVIDGVPLHTDEIPDGCSTAAAFQGLRRIGAYPMQRKVTKVIQDM